MGAVWKADGDISLGQTQAYQPIWQNMLGMQKTMLGQSGGKALPWFMQSPQPGGREYNQLQNSMNNLGRLGRTAAANQQSNSLADFYASRGTPMSSNQASNLPGFNRWYATEVGREKSNSALAMFDIAQQMRQQGQNNFYNLNNLLQGGQVQSQPTAWASTFGQMNSA